jgi:membrane protein implicated in regulation of membrane protease activity
MSVSAATMWWVLAGILVAVELAIGTFYLLMIALGLAAAAVAAHLGMPLPGQIATAAVIGGGATALWHWRRYRNPRSAPASSNRDVNLDIGAHVQVDEWAADRTTRVSYRGAGWPARLAPGATPTAGQHEVVAVEGNWLVLSPLDLPARN